MSEQMEFPETFDEFADFYGFKDSKEVYTNGSELIPVFRVKQWLEHCADREKGEWIEKDTPDAYRWKCSYCGLTRHCKENFCPNCGADMRGKAE